MRKGTSKGTSKGASKKTPKGAKTGTVLAHEVGPGAIYNGIKEAREKREARAKKRAKKGILYK